MANETTAKFRVDISDLKKGIQEANRQIRLANAEFKAASAGLDNWSKSADGLSAKISQQQKVLKAQKTILSDYEKQLMLIEKQYGADSKEADEMRIKIENQRAAVATTQKTIGEYSGKLEALKADQDRAKTATSQLTDTIERQQKELETLKDRYKNAVIEQGKDSDAARELAEQIGKLSGELKDNQQRMQEATGAADDLDKTLQTTEETTGKTSGGFTVFKGVLADLVATGIKAAISGLKDLASAAKDAYAEFDSGRDTLIAKTGATGAAADDLIGVYKNVSKSVVGDFDDMGSAVGELNTRFGINGTKLETLSQKFLKFSKLNGTDVSSSVDDVQKAMSAFGLSSDKAEDVLDALNKVAQDTGVGISTLTKGLIQNGAAFQEMGLGLSESAALMGQMEKSGANTETVMNGLRKALKSATKDGIPLSQALSELEKEIIGNADSTKGLQAAYDAFGKSGDQIYNALKNGSLSFKEAALSSADYSGSIETTYENTQDATDKIKLAFQSMRISIGDTVAKIAEKYGPDIVKAIDAVTPAVESVISWIAENVPPAIETVKSAFDTVAPIIGSVFGWIVDHKTELIAALAGIGAAIIAWNIASAVSGLMSMVSALKAMGVASAVTAAKQWLLNTALAANPIGIVVAAIAGLVAAFAVLWNTSDGFRQFWIDLWNSIQEAAEAFIDNIVEGWKTIGEVAESIWSAIKEVWSAVADWFSENVIEPVVGFFTGLFDAVTGAASSAWEFIKSVWAAVSGWFDNTIIKPVANFFTGMWDGLKNGAKSAWEGIKNVFGGIADWFKDKFSRAWQAVKDVFSTGGKVFEGIKDGIVSAFKFVVNAIIRGINKVIAIPFNVINGILDKIYNIEIIGIRPFDWLTARLPVPQIPELERGGVLKRGQVGILEGNGAEAVVPLENNKKWIAATVSQLRRSLSDEGIIGTGGGASGGVTNNYNFTQNNTSPKALSRLEIYRQSKNLLSMKGAT